MKKSIFLLKLWLFLSFYFLVHINSSYCQNLKSIMVNACAGSGSEGDNEYLILQNGASSFTISSANIDLRDGNSYPASTSITNPLVTGGNSGFIAALNTLLPSGCDFSFVNGTTSTTIPANSYFVVMDANPTDTADFSAWCGSGIGNTPIAFSADPSWSTVGVFPNNSSGNAHIQININGTTKNYNYSNAWSSNADGNYAVWQDTGQAQYCGNYSGCTPINTYNLPVELLSLEARALGAANQIQWQTASEVNNYGFVVYRRNEGGDYDSIGFVKGNGNSASIQSYAYADLHPQLESNWYLIEQLDFNQDSKRYGPVWVHRPVHPTLISIHPNPCFNQLTISLTNMEEDVNVYLYNLYGTLLLNYRLDKSAVISTNELPDGVYYLHFQWAENTENMPFIKTGER
ncbi:MAG: hypothetical protein ACI8ZN_001559 [Bacteroidia bacterium]|jgi:hypothetical protein